MAEETTPRGNASADLDASPEKSAIEKAREEFLRRGTRDANSSTGPAAKTDPREAVADASARPVGMAERGAMQKGMIDVLADITKERAYRNWAEQDVEEMRGIREPDARAAAISQLATNARDSGYAHALRWVDPDLANTVMETVRASGDAREARAAGSGPESGPAVAEVSPATPVPLAAAGLPAANEPAAREAGRPETAANEPRVALAERVVANDAQARPDLSIDQPALDQVAARRARDLEAARAAIAQPVAQPGPQPSGDPVAITRVPAAVAENGIELLSTRTVDVRGQAKTADARAKKDGYEIPAAILSRYVVHHGKYWKFDGTDKTPEARGEPHFEDRGARLATPSDDRNTVADMIAVAQAKGWKEVTLNGSEEFRRNAWIEASLAGIEAKGFQPQARDEALLEAARRERESLNISAPGREPQAPGAPDAAKETPAPNEVVKEVAAREAVRENATPARDAAAPAVRVGQLREQLERATAHLPENVRRELMNRTAERVAAGTKVEREHQRGGASRETLAPALAAGLRKADQDRVARQAPPAEATPKASGRSRGVPDKDVPDLGR
ncbi:hypothetical protein R75461_07298 [Paraburkholderia nemoris]|uniref:LPD7 domain-containing protein n=1 Tax=Paraburkholderia nemoris TaxID=2793076 RepID=UPI00190BB258|nr:MULTISPECIES: LPD7 domain-containing protein [Paraburkholderia]MBK3786050.1 hypothetical protein [Paraburkholderia aspalathi]CAE6847139.1 hypothetical protein R75461_07298 [Paraburkholderia nemoris]